MSADVVRRRRAAGTQTFTDMLRIWFGALRPDLVQDIADLEAGVCLEVSCFLRQHNSTMRAQYGTLVLHRGDPVVWRPRRGEVVTFVPPMRFSASVDRARGPQFTALRVDSGCGVYDVQIPSVDVELLMHAVQHRPATE